MCAKRILTVGRTNIDFVLTTPYLPAPGETLRSGGEYSFMPGGKGANAAAAAAAFGADSVFCTRVGDDAYGDRMLRALEERGINTKYVRVDRHEQTGLAVITVEKDGTNRIIVYPGANDKINLGDLEAAFTCYPDAVLVQFEINRDTVISAARLAADESIPLIVDAGPATPDFPLEKLERVEILTPNETETEILTGIRPNSLENCLRASMALCSRVPTKYVVLKLGGRGCYVYDGKYCDIISPFDTNVVDTTAAGDIFTAALAAEYLRSGDIIASARFANAAGALAVSKRGSMNSVPALAQVNELLANG